LLPRREPQATDSHAPCALTCNADATYTYTFKAKKTKLDTDKAVANGVTITEGALFSKAQLRARSRGAHIDRDQQHSPQPRSSALSNLPTARILTVNGNNFQANYEGGDGNDLR